MPSVLVDALRKTDKLIRTARQSMSSGKGRRESSSAPAGASLKKNRDRSAQGARGNSRTKIFLELFVKVLRDWRDNPQLVRQLDWHLQLERLTGESFAIYSSAVIPSVRMRRYKWLRSSPSVSAVRVMCH